MGYLKFYPETALETHFSSKIVISGIMKINHYFRFFGSSNTYLSILLWRRNEEDHLPY